MRDDRELLDAWRGGDGDAGEALFERYYRSVACFFRSKAGEDAGDLLQRTFLTLVENRTPGASALLAQRQETQLLLQALRRIPVELQIILELYYWEHMTAKEIADVLEMPEGTARTRIRRAKLLLEEKLAEVAQSPALLQSTLSDLDSWAAQLRAALKPTN